MGPIWGGIKHYKSSNLYGNFDGFPLDNNALFGARCHIVTDPWLVTFPIQQVLWPLWPLVFW